MGLKRCRQIDFSCLCGSQTTFNLNSIRSGRKLKRFCVESGEREREKLVFSTIDQKQLRKAIWSDGFYLLSIE
jgi:hypothetical protein